MQRIPEPELMNDAGQVTAYAAADFNTTDARFIERFRELFGENFAGRMLDLGCGPGNISLRMAAAFPQARITGVDGADAMLAVARQRAAELPESNGRLAFIEATLPHVWQDETRYDAIVCNSFLHHLHDPMVLWQAVQMHAAEGCRILCVDLRRPASPEAARQLQATHVANEAAILQEDFYNSLLAAFTAEEVCAQLAAAGLDYLQIREKEDRYLEVSGRFSSVSDSKSGPESR
mgnify:CR=1 FL=1